MKRVTSSVARGFTLIEVIVVMVILGVIGLGVVALVSEGAEAYIISRRQAELEHAGRLAAERMAREIREINNSSITAATATQLTFTNPYNTALTGGANAVTFRLTGGKIERSGDGGSTWATLAENVTNTDIFTYYRFGTSGRVITFTPSSPYTNIVWILIKVDIDKDGRSVSRRQQVYLQRDHQ